MKNISEKIEILNNINMMSNQIDIEINKFTDQRERKIADDVAGRWITIDQAISELEKI